MHAVVMRVLGFTALPGILLRFTLSLRRSSPGRTTQAGVLRGRVVANQGHSVIIARVNLVGDALALVNIVEDAPNVPSLLFPEFTYVQLEVGKL